MNTNSVSNTKKTSHLLFFIIFCFELETLLTVNSFLVAVNHSIYILPFPLIITVIYRMNSFLNIKEVFAQCLLWPTGYCMSVQNHLIKKSANYHDSDRPQSLIYKHRLPNVTVSLSQSKPMSSTRLLFLQYRTRLSWFAATCVLVTLLYQTKVAEHSCLHLNCCPAATKSLFKFLFQIWGSCLK